MTGSEVCYTTEWTRLCNAHKRIVKAFKEIDDVADWLSEWEDGELTDVVRGMVQTLQDMVNVMPHVMEDIKIAYDGKEGKE